MSTEADYVKAIRAVANNGRLLELWDQCINNTYDKGFWRDGKLLEYIVLRGFELEREGCVTYPFIVKDPDIEYNGALEQIDGAVHVDELHALVECKDYSSAKIKVEPLTKMRNQLARRHGAMFGMFFTSTPLTTPTLIQVKYMAPQIIIIWTKEDIEHCIKYGRFIECMRTKYKMAVEHCNYKFDFHIFDADINKYLGTPLW